MMKNQKIIVEDTKVTFLQIQDFLFLAKMIKAKDGEFLTSDWLWNRNRAYYEPISKKQTGVNIYKIRLKGVSNGTAS